MVDDGRYGAGSGGAGADGGVGSGTGLDDLLAEPRTHYLGVAKGTRLVFMPDDFLDGVRAIIAAGGVPVGSLSCGEPVLTNALMEIVGEPGDTGDPLHVTSDPKLMPRGSWVIDTEDKPYDVVVCAVMLLLAEYNDGVTVSSDGEWDDEGWLAARALFARAIGHEPKQPADVHTHEQAERISLTAKASGLRGLGGTTKQELRTLDDGYRRLRALSSYGYRPVGRLAGKKKLGGGPAEFAMRARIAAAWMLTGGETERHLKVEFHSVDDRAAISEVAASLRALGYEPSTAGVTAEELEEESRDARVNNAVRASRKREAAATGRTES